MMAIDQIKARGGNLFQRGSLLSLWQELADNFQPDLEFTVRRTIGTDYASNLMTSFPLLMQRDLTNAFAAMLRPTSKPWFKLSTNRPDREDTEAKQYLEWATKLQRNAMYDLPAQFNRATKETDAYFSLIGQGVIQVDMYRPLDGSTPHLLHRAWNPRDCAWAESHTGQIDTMFRVWEAFAFDLVQTFPDTVNEEVRRNARERPYDMVKVWHVVMPAELYNAMDGVDKKINQKWVSLFIDVEHDTLLEVKGQLVFNYVVPRWRMISGSQYAHSPVTMAALPDARLIQAISRVLLEAGEKAVNPPMIGVREALRSDLQVFAGGFTAVDAEYDERLGEVLRPLTQDTKNLAFGEKLLQDIRMQLTSAFMLNKLNLPPAMGGDKMTAYEVAQRTQEFIRNALPLFEPMEVEYNGALCELDFQLLLNNSVEMRQRIPESIRGVEYKFVFESPLKEAMEKIKVGQFTEGGQILVQAQALDPSAAVIINGKKAVRDVMSVVVPADWLRTETEVDRLLADQAAQQKQDQMMAMLAEGAGAASDLGSALKSGAEAAQLGGIAA
jgi:hypothetical protein